MIIDMFERPAQLDGIEAIREMYVLGHDKSSMDAYGHVIVDYIGICCFIHAQVYDKKFSSIKQIKEDINDIIDAVIIGEYEYSMFGSYTPNVDFLKFIIANDKRDKDWVLSEHPINDDITLFLYTKRKDEPCQSPQ